MTVVYRTCQADHAEFAPALAGHFVALPGIALLGPLQLAARAGEHNSLGQFLLPKIKSSNRK